jgi:hypothetical protein
VCGVQHPRSYGAVSVRRNYSRSCACAWPSQQKSCKPLFQPHGSCARFSNRWREDEFEIGLPRRLGPRVVVHSQTDLARHLERSERRICRNCQNGLKPIELPRLDLLRLSLYRNCCRGTRLGRELDGMAQSASQRRRSRDLGLGHAVLLIVSVGIIVSDCEYSLHLPIPTRPPTTEFRSRSALVTATSANYFRPSARRSGRQSVNCPGGG